MPTTKAKAKATKTKEGVEWTCKVSDCKESGSGHKDMESARDDFGKHFEKEHAEYGYTPSVNYHDHGAD
jgi:hypothetical protein